MDNSQLSAVIRRAAKGDEAAFAMLVEQYQQMVYHLSFSLLRNREDALDVSQEVFLKVYRFLPEFHFESSFSTWIYRITKNAALDYLRAGTRHNRTSIEALSDLGVPLQDDDPGTDPQTAAVAADRAARLYRAIGLLSEAHREVILLSSFCGESYESIAEKLGIELGTVKSRINRAKHELRKILEDGNFF